MGQSQYWTAMVHLWFINFPFVSPDFFLARIPSDEQALLVWPPLLVGTLVGTALLITLPLGAAVWWITLFISRWAARMEVLMQLHYHSPLHPSVPQPIYHPIFYRIKDRTGHPPHAAEVPHDDIVEWETRFLRCSYAMVSLQNAFANSATDVQFLDHYSYSSLSYFLLVKPLLVLLSTIALWVLFLVSAVLVFTIPIYLRAARRWGSWQAGVAMGNL